MLTIHASDGHWLLRDLIMAIDKTGKWWKAETAKDALAYLRSLKPGGYTVDEVLTQQCECGSSSFRLYCSKDDELSYLVCGVCKAKTFITDSEEYADGEEFALIKCPCRSTHQRIFLGVHSIDDKTVANWISIAVICEECGVIGSPLDWEFDTDKKERSYAKHTVPLPSKRQLKKGSGNRREQRKRRQNNVKARS